MQAKDSHFEQNSDKLAAKSWHLLAAMGHSLAMISDREHITHACM